jgi:CDP-glucose 4,6-dehydratase
MFWQGKRVLITGHTGFKGSWLSFWLNHLGAEVCGFSLAPNTSPNLFDGLNLTNLVNSTIGDIRNLDLLKKTFEDFQPEIVFHLAAQPLVRRSYLEPIETYSTNVMGTINVLEAIRSVKGVKSVVVVTTDKVYENFESTIGYTENDRLGGFDPYSNSKACAELAVSAYRNSFFAKSETLIATARAGNVIGGGDWSEDRLLPDVFRSLIFGKELIIRNPNSVRPWQHVLEPLNGYMMLAEKLFSGDKSFAESWNFGPEEEDSKSVGWILEEIKKLWNGEVNWKIAEGNHPHETNFLKLDSTKAKVKLDWNPELNFLEALKLTNKWYETFRDKNISSETTKQQIEFYLTKGVI